MASQGESKLPLPGSTKEKRRSLLPSPKSFRKSSEKAASPRPSSKNGGSKREAACMSTEVPSAPLPLNPGQRVCIAGVKPGVVRYFGKTKFADGDWCGIELDECDGKHDGTVEGVKYFTCEAGYGIFAPSHKVQRLEEVVLPEKKSEKHSKLQQPKAFGLPKRRSSSRSKSPEEASSSTVAASDGSEPLTNRPQQSPRFISKLLRPRATGHKSSLLEGDKVEGKPPPGPAIKDGLDRGFVDEKLTSSPRPSRLPKQASSSSSGVPIKRSHSALEAADVQRYHSAIPKPGSKRESNEASQAAPSLSDTYTLSDFREVRGEDRRSVQRSERTTKARSFSHDLTATDGQLPFQLGAEARDQQKDGLVRSSNSSLCSRSSTGSLSSPIPDILTQSTILGKKKKPVGFAGEAMSEPEDDADFLSSSSLSHASSLGILSDSVIRKNSLFTEGQATEAATDVMSAKQTIETESKDATEIMEKELDNEISGISTPEIDMSSSTISGKELCSSPDMEDGKRDLEIESQNGQGGGAGKDGKMAGERLATPATSSESSPESDKVTEVDTEQPSARPTSKPDTKPSMGVIQSPLRDKRPSRDSSVDSTDDGGRRSKRSSSAALEELEQYPRVMRTSRDLDDLEASSMSASVEIAKTAVQQYAELMAAAERERQASVKHREALAARRAARRSSADRARSVDSSDEEAFVVQRSSSMGAVDYQDERSQLLVDLEAGHTKQERPVSIISTGSADTGIVADLPPTPQPRRERPVSLLSTSSVDTGYQPDTDSEIGTLTANSPLDDESPQPGRPHVATSEDLSPRSEALALDAAYKETLANYQQVAGLAVAPELTSDFHPRSDASTFEEGPGAQQDELEMNDMMIQQNLLETGLEKMLDVMPGDAPLLALEGDSPGTDDLEFPGYNQEAQESSTEEEDAALCEGQQTPISDLHVPMETIPEQDTPDSPEVDLLGAQDLKSPVDEDVQLSEHSDTSESVKDSVQAVTATVEGGEAALKSTSQTELREKELENEQDPGKMGLLDTDLTNCNVTSERLTPLDGQGNVDTVQETDSKIVAEMPLTCFQQPGLDEPDGAPDYQMQLKDLSPSPYTKANTDMEHLKSTEPSHIVLRDNDENANLDVGLSNQDCSQDTSKNLSLTTKDIIDTVVGSKNGEDYRTLPPVDLDKSNKNEQKDLHRDVTENDLYVKSDVSEADRTESRDGLWNGNIYAGELKNREERIHGAEVCISETSPKVETSVQDIVMEISVPEEIGTAAVASKDNEYAASEGKPEKTIPEISETVPVRETEKVEQNVSSVIAKVQDEPCISELPSNVEVSGKEEEIILKTPDTIPHTEIEKMNLDLYSVETKKEDDVVTSEPAIEEEKVEKDIPEVTDTVTTEEIKEVKPDVSIVMAEVEGATVILEAESEICESTEEEETEKIIPEMSNAFVGVESEGIKLDVANEGTKVEDKAVTLASSVKPSEKEKEKEEGKTVHEVQDTVADDGSEKVTLDMSRVMAKVEDAPISSSEDAITTRRTVDSTVLDVSLPEVSNELRDPVLLESISRSCMQGLPPPVEPEGSSFSHDDSSSAVSPEMEVNQNITPTTEDQGRVCDSQQVGTGRVDTTLPDQPPTDKHVENDDLLEAAVEELILPSGVYSPNTKDEEPSVPDQNQDDSASGGAIDTRDLITVTESITLESQPAKLEADLVVEELISPVKAHTIESSVPQALLVTKHQEVPKELEKKEVKSGIKNEPVGMVSFSDEQSSLEVSMTASVMEETEKEKASVDEDKESVIRESLEDVPAEAPQAAPVDTQEDVKAEGALLEGNGHMESVTEHEVLVETLEVTEGPLLRTSTPVSDVRDHSQSPVHDEMYGEPLPETSSANTTFTEGDTVPMVEIEIVSEMSESTIKDQGPGEKGQKEEEKPEEAPGDEAQKKNGTKVKTKKIEDVGKVDQKKPAKTARSSLVNSVKSKVSSTTAKTVTKDNDKTTLKNKASKPNTVKSTPTVKKAEVEKKPGQVKTGSRISNYIKEPPRPKTKEDNTVVINNVKTVKNNSNLKKVDSGGGGDRKTVTMPQKRNPPPKSKWGNIMSQIDAGKNNKTNPATVTKPKIEPRTSPRSTLASSTTTSASSKLATPRTSTSAAGTPRSPRDVTPRSPRDATARSTSATSRRTSSTHPADQKIKVSTTTTAAATTTTTTTTSSSTLRASRPGSAGRVKQSPEPPRPDSRLSNASETSGLNTSRNGSLAGSRTTATRPPNRTTAALRKERSPSVGSEKTAQKRQGSSSSHGSRRSVSKERTPEPPRPRTSLVKRQSLTEPSASRLGTVNKAESRRSSLATTYRLSTKKESSPSSSTDKKASNQNRNKTSKPASASSSLKRTNQPDVVTNSTAPPGAAEEIARLEALCETRTKQLNIARMQLKASAQGFDAMTVLVKYLTEELDAFSCPEVTAKLKGVKAQLGDAQTQIDALARDKESLEKSLTDLKSQQANEIQRLNEIHQAELQQLTQRLQSEKAEEVEKVVEKYSLEVSTLKSFLEKNISDLKSKHEQTLKDHDTKHAQDVEEVKKEHETRVQEGSLDASTAPVSTEARDLQKKHERRMEEITRTFENIKFTLSEKVETLRGECEEMRSREAHLQERTQREADLKIHMALAQFKHLPAEIESLKAVMEMRNQELHELRHKKLELEKQLEELPKAREKIISLQQKVENLEAVIQIKADYEKQLAEKHQILLRKFDKESKANKRLSMDNEELSWRLANSAESPDLLRRSISHSPTRTSAEPTPEVVRRRKSPACSIPTSPRNQTEFERSPVALQSPPKSNLKRSGTYDLLNKDLDEKDMKQSDV